MTQSAEERRESKKLYMRRIRKENPEIPRMTQNKFYENNPLAKRKHDLTYRAKNAEKLKEYWKTYYQKNKEKRLNQKRPQRINDPERCRLFGRIYQATRRALKRQATPAWADMEMIKEIYRKAADMAEKYNIKYHVDHIIPLNSPIVCGLHWHHNLQILKAEENLSKGNRF